MQPEDQAVTEEIESTEEVTVDEEQHEGEESQESSEVEAVEVEEVTFGEESPPREEPAPEWVKELRRNHREAQKRIKELESQLVQHPKKVQLGKKPTLDDFDYDAEAFQAALDKYYSDKAEFERQESLEREAQESQQKEWQQKLKSFEDQKLELKSKFQDIDDRQAAVEEALTPVQQGILLAAADNAALMVAALGVNNAKLRELASVKDPVKFASMVGKLESKLQTTKKAPPPPERVVSGTTGKPISSGDSQLERLREEAARTGDMSKVYAYKQQMKQKAK